MDDNIFNLNNKICTNTSNLLLEIISDLNQIINSSQDNIIIKALGNAINKMNYIINENKKSLEIIRNDISKLYIKLDKKIEEVKVNIINNQELNFPSGKYIGQVINGIADGKGTFYFINGDKYEGEYKLGQKEGKGIYYFHNGERYEGYFKMGKKEGKGIFYYKNGNRYEGDWRNDKKEGKGITYYQNGDRYEGDIINGTPDGKGIYYTKICLIFPLNNLP